MAFLRTKKIGTYSITAKLIIAILLFYLVLAFIFLPWQMISAYYNGQSELHAELENLQTLLQAGLSDAAWRQEDQEIEVLLKGLLHNKDVLGVNMERFQPKETQWQQGFTLQAVAHLDYETAVSKQITNGIWPRLLSSYIGPVVHEFALTHLDEKTHELIVIGRVQFYSNTVVVLESIRTQFVTIFSYAIFRLVLLSFFLIWVGYWILSKPLKVLMQATEAISRGQLEEVQEKLQHHKVSIFQTEVDELVSAFKTMTEQVKTSKEEADQARAHLAEIFNTSSSALIAINEKGYVSDWNTKAEEITKVPREQAVNLLYSDAYPPLKNFKVAIQKVISDHQLQTFKKKQLTNHSYFDIFISPLEKSRVVIRLDDVTEQVKMQEITIQTEKMTSVGLLAAGMAHEINNPLGAVLQSTQNIGRRLDPDLEANIEAAKEVGINMTALVNYLEHRGIYRFLRSIKESGERAAKIVSNLLQFSRRSAGALQMLKPQQFINKALELAVSEKRIFDPTTTPAIVIKTNFAPTLPYVMGNENELEQVMLNLIKNAGQALLESTKPTREIILSTYATRENVIITVKDNGPGMEDIVKNRIFEPFFTTKPIGEGTGLGLSICYRIITESHNGKIFVESTPGVGSTFFVELPVWQAEKLDK
jgi:signal transduction histidine kinase